MHAAVVVHLWSLCAFLCVCLYAAYTYICGHVYGPTNVNIYTCVCVYVCTWSICILTQCQNSAFYITSVCVPAYVLVVLTLSEHPCLSVYLSIIFNPACCGPPSTTIPVLWLIPPHDTLFNDHWLDILPFNHPTVRPVIGVSQDHSGALMAEEFKLEVDMEEKLWG